jgi:hypothetical protein
MKTVDSSIISVLICQITKCHIPEEINVHKISMSWKLNFIKNVAGPITALYKEIVLLMVAGIK